MTARLIVEVISARGLPPADRNGKSDPYVKFYWRGEKFKTEVKKETLNPKWNEKFVLDYDRAKDKRLSLEIWDWDMLASNDPLGKVLLDLEKLDLSGASDGYYPIQALKGNGSGSLRVRITPLIPGRPKRLLASRPAIVQAPLVYLQPQFYPVYQPPVIYYPTPIPYPAPYPSAHPPGYGHPPLPSMPCHPNGVCTCPPSQYPPLR